MKIKINLFVVIVVLMVVLAGCATEPYKRIGKALTRVHTIRVAVIPGSGMALKAVPACEDMCRKVLTGMGYDVVGLLNEKSCDFIVTFRIEVEELGNWWQTYEYGPGIPGGGHPIGEPFFRIETLRLTGGFEFIYLGSDRYGAAMWGPLHYFEQSTNDEYDKYGNSLELYERLIWRDPAVKFIGSCIRLAGIERIAPLKKSSDSALRKAVQEAEEWFRSMRMHW